MMLSRFFSESASRHREAGNRLEELMKRIRNVNERLRDGEAERDQMQINLERQRLQSETHDQSIRDQAESLDDLKRAMNDLLHFEEQLLLWKSQLDNLSCSFDVFSSLQEKMGLLKEKIERLGKSLSAITSVSHELNGSVECLNEWNAKVKGLIESFSQQLSLLPNEAEYLATQGNLESMHRRHNEHIEQLKQQLDLDSVSLNKRISQLSDSVRMLRALLLKNYDEMSARIKSHAHQHFKGFVSGSVPTGCGSYGGGKLCRDELNRRSEVTGQAAQSQSFPLKPTPFPG